MFSYLAGKSPNKIFEPSSGDMGRMLNMASARLICRLMNTINMSSPIMECRSGAASGVKISLNTIPLRSANTIFASGPAALIQSMFFLGFFYRYGFTGTGLAHPKCTIKIMIVPKGSKCLSGFMVKRPRCLAVSSPYLYAI